MLIGEKGDIVQVSIACRRLDRIEPGAAELLRGLNNLPG